MENPIGPLFYRFINRSSANVRVFWVRNKKQRILYNRDTFKPGNFIDVNTFPGHVWMFEKEETGDILLADGCCLFIAQNWLQYMDWLRITHSLERLRTTRPIPRKAIQILSPLYTLKEFALHAVRDIGLNTEQVDSLHIPQTLKVELKKRVKDRECAVSHLASELECDVCPFELHKPKFEHICQLDKIGTSLTPLSVY